MIAKRIRLLINYYVEVESLGKGIVKAKTFDIADGLMLVNERAYNLKKVYPFYNTKEVIRNKEDDEL